MLILEDGAPIGYITYFFSFTTMMGRRALWLEDLFIEPEFRGKGIGKALLSRAMCTARDAGAKWFFLGATPSGYPLYVRLGYETAFEAQVWVRGETSQA